MGQERTESRPGADQEWARSMPGVCQQRTNSRPGADQEWALTAPGVGQERTESKPGEHHDWARSTPGVTPCTDWRHGDRHLGLCQCLLACCLSIGLGLHFFSGIPIFLNSDWYVDMAAKAAQFLGDSRRSPLWALYLFDIGL